MLHPVFITVLFVLFYDSGSFVSLARLTAYPGRALASLVSKRVVQILYSIYLGPMLFDHYPNPSLPKYLLPPVAPHDLNQVVFPP